MNSEILDRLPPQNLEAEKAVLGSILLDGDVFEEVSAILDTDDFYADANQRLFGHLKAMNDDRQPIDALLLMDRIAAAGEKNVIDDAYLATVAQSVPFAANATHYASKVARCSKLRKIIYIATAALRDAYTGSLDPLDILNSTESGLAKITTQNYRGGPVHIREAVIEAVERIDAIMQREQSAGLFTGFTEFDSKYGGLFPGELIILAARPGVGKTSLACQIADYVSGRGRLVYFASLEMSAVELATRMACTIGEVNSRSIRTGTIGEIDSKRFCDATSRLGNQALYVHNLPGMKVSDIRRASRRHIKDGLALVVVDYLQLITAVSEGKSSREEKVASMSRELKQLAGELKVPVLCLCQLNREAAKSEEPGLHHLRESGAIEQDADMVMFLHETEGSYKLLIKKNRNGSVGWMPLHWDAAITKFACEPPANYEPAFGNYGDSNWS